MEVRFDGFDRLQNTAVVADVEAVFDEIRRGAEDFFTGREDGAEEGVETAGGADRQNQMLLADGDALLFRQIFRKCLADIIIACIGHIAETGRLVGVDGHLLDAVDDGFWRREIGIAEGEVANGLFAVFLLQFDARLEHAANPRGVFLVVFDLG